MSVISFSQNLNNFHQKTFEFSDTLIIDTNTIFPSSINIFSENKQISDSLWSFDIQNSTIIFSSSLNNSIIVKYRTLAYDFQPQLLNDTSLIVPKMTNYSIKSNRQSINANDALNSNLLQTDGYMSRSVGVGNNQDPVITSKMNLNISGKLNDDLFIEAVAFDETMPIQPDGNTAKIQELNNIHIKVFNDNFAVTAGDFYLPKFNSYFLKYNKQVKGIHYFTQDKQLVSNINLNRLSFGAGVAKGKYKRQSIAGIEGNQGAYRLTGNNGETYIVVLAGSERVFLNGKILQRGENMDYTINYNTAELVFTAKNPITKDSRIIVEFEYSERNYSRFSIFSNNSFSVKNSDFYFNFFSETDAKNQTIDRELSDDMKLIMFDVGDSLNLALLPNIDTVEFSDDKILYRKVDTVIDNQVLAFYEYSTNPQLAVYQVNFAFVGQGNGNYTISEQLTNGRVYSFVSAENGIKQGDYEPSSVLVTPKKHHVYDFGGSVPISDKNTLAFAISVSQRDKNLFSPKNDNDNWGLALNLNFTHFLKGNDTSSLKSYFFSNYEYASNTYTPVEVYKSQEFLRDWNISQNFFSDEHILKTGVYVFNKKSEFSTIVSSLFHSKEYFSIKPDINGSRIGENNSVLLSASYLYSNNFLHKSNFGRSNFELRQKFGNVALGTTYEQETNIWKDISSDSILKNSFMFHSVGFFMESADTNVLFLKSEYRRRWDFLPDFEKMKKVGFSNDFNLSANVKKSKYNVNLILNYRQLFVQDTSLQKVEPDNSLNAKTNFNFNLFNNAVNSFSSIAISSGLEQKMQFIYIEVEPTKGVYTWVDYNDDGIKQIDEFEVTQFSDQATFIRLPMQSNEYVKTYGKSINQSLNFIPANFFSDTSKIYSLVSKFNNNNTSLNLNHKSYNFDIIDFSDSNAVNYSFLFNNIINFNLFEGVNLRLIYQKNFTKIVMVSGFDNSIKETRKLGVNFRFMKFFILSDEIGQNFTKNKSNYSVQKNYDIVASDNKIILKYFNDDASFELFHFYSDKRNNQGNEVLIMNDFTGNIAYSISAKQSVSTSFSYVFNNFKGKSSSSVAYAMLNGLQPDKNYTWELNLSHKIGKFLSATILYSGRYSSGNKVIHTGAVSLVAFL